MEVVRILFVVGEARVTIIALTNLILPMMDKVTLLLRANDVDFR